jgi:hypothetical protein
VKWRRSSDTCARPGVTSLALGHLVAEGEDGGVGAGAAARRGRVGELDVRVTGANDVWIAARHPVGGGAARDVVCTSAHVVCTSAHVVGTSAHVVCTSAHVVGTSTHVVCTSASVAGATAHVVCTSAPVGCTTAPVVCTSA